MTLSSAARSAPGRRRARPVPVLALTGFLGSGKTTVLNSLLRAPGARLGVVINDFGTIDVDTALVSGQIDEAAAISGGCLCCMPDHDGLDAALSRLAQPSLRLDAILVEASGLAEPQAIARLLRTSPVPGIRAGGVIEMIDAVHVFDTVDVAWPGGAEREPPARWAAADLIVVTRTAQLPPAEREERLARITARVRLRTPRAPIIETPYGLIDPDLVLDLAAREDPQGELPIAAVTRQARAEHDHAHDHALPAAEQVSVRAPSPVDPGRVLDLVEDPPPGVFRMKGTVAVAGPGQERVWLIELVGRGVHVRPHRGPAEHGLVAIGAGLDTAEVQRRLREALTACPEPAPEGMRRLGRARRRG